MKFKSKPRVIEAIQYDGENEEEIWEMFGRDGLELLGDSESFMLEMKTMGGDVVYARPGDWITPDELPGTFYPIQDSWMKAKYDPIDEGEVDG